jgi:hypothetical protein
MPATSLDCVNNDVLVLFVLTHHFYAIPICLCEMGATWVLAREHIPVLVPTFEFSDVKGAIPLTQGFMLNDALRLNRCAVTSLPAPVLLVPASLCLRSWRRFGVRRTAPTRGIGSNRACLSGRLRKYVRFPFGSCFFCRRQRTLPVETLSPDAFGIGAGCTRGGLVEVRSSPLDLGRSLQLLRVLERLVFGVRELVDQKRLLRKSQRPSKGTFEVSKRQVSRPD